MERDQKMITHSIEFVYSKTYIIKCVNFSYKKMDIKETFLRVYQDWKYKKIKNCKENTKHEKSFSWTLNQTRYIFDDTLFIDNKSPDINDIKINKNSKRINLKILAYHFKQWARNVSKVRKVWYIQS